MNKKMKKVWNVIWDETSIYPLVCAILGVGLAFGSYKLYTLLSYVTGWRTISLWITIVSVAILALIFIVCFIVGMFGKLGEIVDAIKYDDKKDEKNKVS